MCSVAKSCLILCDPMDCSQPGSSDHGILQERILEWVAMPSSRGLPNLGIKPRSPTLQVDFLPTEPAGKPKNTRVCSLSLLQGNFSTQELNLGLLLAGGFLTSWAACSIQFSHSVMSKYLWPHGLQHIRLLCLVPTPGACSNSCFHWVGDDIQPSHPLSSPFPPAFSLSQNQGLFQWVSSSHQVAKVLELQLQH